MVSSKKRARHNIEEIIALFPDAVCLDFTNHFELLGCVMLSNRRQVPWTQHYTRYFCCFSNAFGLRFVATESEIASHISRLGLYRSLRLNSLKMCPITIRRFDGRSQTREELELPAWCWSCKANVVERWLWDSALQWTPCYAFIKMVVKKRGYTLK